MLKWDELPQEMQLSEVKPYYQLVSRRKGSLIFKRCLDLFLAVVLLILTSPLFLILSIWIKLDSKGPVIYKQVRVTQYNRHFKIWKFRTMVTDADKKGSLVTSANDSRITKVGNFIRRVRLDELPQLVNVLKGEMSFVGTRPEVPRYTEQYSPEMIATLLLPAGVTSLASINYKDEDAIISQMTAKGMTVDQAYVERVLPEKMHFNLAYLRDFNFFGDIKIMFQTVVEVLK